MRGMACHQNQQQGVHGQDDKRPTNRHHDRSVEKHYKAGHSDCTCNNDKLEASYIFPICLVVWGERFFCWGICFGQFVRLVIVSIASRCLVETRSTLNDLLLLHDELIITGPREAAVALVFRQMFNWYQCEVYGRSKSKDQVETRFKMSGSLLFEHNLMAVGCFYHPIRLRFYQLRLFLFVLTRVESELSAIFPK